MSGEAKKVSALRITAEGMQKVQEVVATEYSLTIMLDNKDIVTLLCSPRDLEWLAVGYLLSEGLIHDKATITHVELEEKENAIRVITQNSIMTKSEPKSARFLASSGWRGSTLSHSIDTASLTKMSSKMQIASSDVFAMVADFEGCSKLFKDTGGVHSAALCSTNSILLFTEDIGRHNAIDKIFGGCLLKGIDT